MPIAGRPATSGGLQHQPAAFAGGDNKTSAGRMPPMAPLASLDCSITEPIGDLPAGQRSEPATLSSLYDCDQLSDMIDDSLFEITNFGCKSATLFNPAPLVAKSRPSLPLKLDPEPSRIGLESDEPSTPGTPTNVPAKVAGPQSPPKNSPVTTTTTSSQTSAKRASKRRRSTRLSERDSATRSTTNICDQCSKELESSRSASNKTLGKPEKKHRFTFSLFNLFGSSNQNFIETKANGQALDKIEPAPTCRHRRPLEQAPVAKARDSIRLAGHRRRAQSAGYESRPVASLGRCHHQHRHQPEVLLELTRSHASQGDESAGAQSSPQVSRLTQRRSRRNQPHEYHSRAHRSGAPTDLAHSSHASHPIHVSQNKHHHHHLQHHLQHHPQPQQTNQGNQATGKQTKCVKFTTPDRVVFLSSNSNHLNLKNRSELRPGLPIIKRPVPRSSSYSQTDSDKKLDELLASYELNETLIAQINEKLNLTETIASPKSTLDQLEEQMDLNSDDHPSGEQAEVAATTTAVTLTSSLDSSSSSSSSSMTIQLSDNNNPESNSNSTKCLSGIDHSASIESDSNQAATCRIGLDNDNNNNNNNDGVESREAQWNDGRAKLSKESSDWLSQQQQQK